jgi:hypothetical protein
MAIIRKATFEERNDEGEMPPPNPPNPPNTPPVHQDDGDFNPQDHPWGYSDQARIHISDLLLQPSEDTLKEFTFMPQGIVFEMVLGDSMVAMQKNYYNKGFNLAEFLLKTVDKRLRGLDGKMVKYGVLLAGDERKEEEINPNSGPML